MQVNGKLRGVVTVPPAITDAELEKLALADAERPGAHRRQDGEESRDREGSTGVDRRMKQAMTSGRMTQARARCARCRCSPPASARRRAATRWPAAARSCPTTSRRSASRCSATARRIRRVEQIFTQKVRARVPEPRPLHGGAERRGRRRRRARRDHSRSALRRSASTTRSWRRAIASP